MVRNEAGGRVKLGRKPPSREEQLSEEEIQRMTEEVMRIYVDPECTKDPFMSPGLAPSDMLKGLPPVHIVVSQPYICTHSWQRQWQFGIVKGKFMLALLFNFTANCCCFAYYSVHGVHV